MIITNTGSRIVHLTALVEAEREAHAQTARAACKVLADLTRALYPTAQYLNIDASSANGGGSGSLEFGSVEDAYGNVLTADDFPLGTPEDNILSEALNLLDEDNSDVWRHATVASQLDLDLLGSPR